MGSLKRKKKLKAYNIKNFLYYKVKRKTPISRIPKFLKFKRYFQHLILNNATIVNITKTKLQYGVIGLQALQSGYLTLPQIDILKKFLYPISKNKYFRSNLIYLCLKIFTTRIITQKPIQSRIGRGKGISTHWYCRVYKNEVLIEFRNIVNFYKCLKFLRLVSKKLPLLTRVITKKEFKIGLLPLNNYSKVGIIIKNIYIA